MNKNTLKSNNRENIRTIICKCKDKESDYERNAFWGLFFGWSLWMIVTFLGLSVSTLEGIFINNENRTDAVGYVVIVLGLTVTAIGIVQQKIKPYKRGRLYKDAAKSIRKISREAARLRHSNMTQADVAIRLDELFEEIDIIGLELYSSNEIQDTENLELKRFSSMGNSPLYRRSINIATPPPRDGRERSSSAPTPVSVMNDSLEVPLARDPLNIDEESGV